MGNPRRNGRDETPEGRRTEDSVLRSDGQESGSHGAASNQQAEDNPADQEPSVAEPASEQAVSEGLPGSPDTRRSSISRTILAGSVSVALQRCSTFRTRFVLAAAAVAAIAVALQQLPWRHQDAASTVPPWLIPHKDAVNIALAGAAGNGKSTLINTLRGVMDDESDAALTGEITMTPENYPWRAYGERPVVQLWDLAGAGTENFPEHSYCEDMGLRWFDAVIIVVSRRIREVDIRILQHLQEHGIRVFVVRTQVNLDIASQKRKGIGEEQTVKAMRDRMIKELNIEGPYLTSGLLEHQSDLDFPKLKEDLILFMNESKAQLAR